MKPINWRLLARHVLAIPCLLLGARQLQAIRTADIVQAYQEHGMQGLRNMPHQYTLEEMTFKLQSEPLYAGFVAMMLGCLLSALVVWRQRESFLIPLLLLAAAFLSSRTHYYKSEVVRTGLTLLRWPLESWPLAARLAVVGGSLVTVGVLLLLVPPRQRVVVEAGVLDPFT